VVSVGLFWYIVSIFIIILWQRLPMSKTWSCVEISPTAVHHQSSRTNITRSLTFLRRGPAGEAGVGAGRLRPLRSPKSICWGSTRCIGVGWWYAGRGRAIGTGVIGGNPLEFAGAGGGIVLLKSRSPIMVFATASAPRWFRWS